MTKINKFKLIVVGVILLLMIIAIQGILAYFIDTETVTNVFTLGNIDITLTEVWNAEDGRGLYPRSNSNKRTINKK